jgi:hypothetical protein
MFRVNRNTPKRESIQSARIVAFRRYMILVITERWLRDDDGHAVVVPENVKRVA